MTHMVIGDVPRLHARSIGQEVAYIDGDVCLTWSEVEDRCTRLANTLSDRFEVRSGDRIAVLSANCHQYVELMFAASKLAAIYTGLNTRHHLDEMRAQIIDADASLIVSGPGFRETADSLADELGLPHLEFGSDAYEAELAAASSTTIDSHGDEDAPYTLTYTSGTTGEPKGAMITSRNEFMYVGSLSWAAETRRDDRFLLVTPMFHKGGQFSTMYPAVMGLSTVILPSPDPIAILDTIQRHRITTVVLVPTIMKMLLDADVAAEQAYDVSSLRQVIYGSNPISMALLRAFSERFDCALSQIGGVGTEGGVGLVLDRVDHERALREPDLEHRLLSCGRVQPGFELAIVDDEDAPVPVGELGEMVFRGDAFIRGYWRRPESSERLWRNGWLHSGDIGRVDEDGYVYYVDRKAGRIKTGAETVYAREVEAIVRSHPLVADVVVIGVPDETWGEAVWAAVEPAGDATDVSAADIQQHVRSKLAGFKVPKRVVVMDELPRTALGKLAIGEVRAALTTEMSTG